MLADPWGYSGGGTYFHCLKATLRLRQGQVLCHPGSLWHSCVDITQGVRVLMGSFLYGLDPEVEEDSYPVDQTEYQRNILFC